MRDAPIEAVAAKDAQLEEQKQEIAAKGETLEIQQARIDELESQLNQSKSKLGAAQ